LFELQQRRGRLREVIRQQVQEERSRTAERSEGSQPMQTDQHSTKRSRDEVVPKGAVVAKVAPAECPPRIGDPNAPAFKAPPPEKAKGVPPKLKAPPPSLSDEGPPPGPPEVPHPDDIPAEQEVPAPDLKRFKYQKE
jgi:hypothetical protein